MSLSEAVNSLTLVEAIARALLDSIRSSSWLPDATGIAELLATSQYQASLTSTENE